jgi:hypothetical protein
MKDPVMITGRFSKLWGLVCWIWWIRKEDGRAALGRSGMSSTIKETVVRRGQTIPQIIRKGQHLRTIRMMKILPRPLTFWYLKNENTREWNWKQNQVPFITVKIEEDFWHIHNYLELASKLDDGCDYSVFKQGIFPDWEDRENMVGGRWILHAWNEEVLDNWWQKLVTVMVEEETSLVNGVVVSKRKKGD